jgi:hypothetical protein
MDDYDRAYDLLGRQASIRRIEPDEFDFDLECFTWEEKIFSNCVGLKEKSHGSEVYFHSWYWEKEVKHLAEADRSKKEKYQYRNANRSIDEGQMGIPSLSTKPRSS